MSIGCIVRGLVTVECIVRGLVTVECIVRGLVTVKYIARVLFIYLGFFTSLSTLYRSYHDG